MDVKNAVFFTKGRAKFFSGVCAGAHALEDCGRTLCRVHPIQREPGCVQRCLWLQSKVQHVGNHLSNPQDAGCNFQNMPFYRVHPCCNLLRDAKLHTATGTEMQCNSHLNFPGEGLVNWQFTVFLAGKGAEFCMTGHMTTAQLPGTCEEPCKRGKHV